MWVWCWSLFGLNALSEPLLLLRRLSCCYYAKLSITKAKQA